MGYCSEVQKFSSVANNNLPKKPQLLTKGQVEFITKMVSDEMEELAEATNIQGQADALVDAIYYICDTATKHGINLDPLFAIVHDANMRKLVDGKVIRREDGKIMKPDGWYPSDKELEVEVNRQLAEGAF